MYSSVNISRVIRLRMRVACSMHVGDELALPLVNKYIAPGKCSVFKEHYVAPTSRLHAVHYNGCKADTVGFC